MALVHRFNVFFPSRAFYQHTEYQTVNTVYRKYSSAAIDLHRKSEPYSNQGDYDCVRVVASIKPKVITVQHMVKLYCKTGSHIWFGLLTVNFLCKICIKTATVQLDFGAFTHSVNGTSLVSPVIYSVLKHEDPVLYLSTVLSQSCRKNTLPNMENILTYSECSVFISKYLNGL